MRMNFCEMKKWEILHERMGFLFEFQVFRLTTFCTFVLMKENLKHQLAQTIRAYNAKGWSPATSTNYSFRETAESKDIVISRSGVDKAEFTSEDFMEVDFDGKPLSNYYHMKPSAETGIHCVLYELFPEATVILHSHSVYPVLLSMVLPSVIFEGFEVQKGFDGVQSHESKVNIPIFENSQDMDDFKNWLREHVDQLKHHCFIIKGHGTYAWGKNLFEAKRHLETLDYLCELTWKRRK